MSRGHLCQQFDQLTEANKTLAAKHDKLRRDVLRQIRQHCQVLSDTNNIDLVDLLNKYKSDVEMSFPLEKSLPRLFWEQQMKYAQMSGNTCTMRCGTPW